MGSIHTITTRPLSEFVDFLWLAEGYAQPHAAERILPTGRMDLVVNLDETPGWRTVAAGARSASMVLSTAQPLTLMGVGFRPGGGFPFFACPAGELQDLSIPLDALWGATANFLREQLLEATTVADRFAILESHLLEYLHARSSAPRRHPAIHYALNAFQSGSPATTVAAIVEHTGLSARKFIELFRSQVGLTPKVFSRMCRFRRALASIGPAADLDWAETALACGYFDQAHFIHDFRQFAGVSPAAYLRRRTTNPNHLRIP